MKTSKKTLRTESSRPGTPQPVVPTPDEISRRAYLLWEQEGRPAGCDVKFWLEAEAEIRQAHNQAGSQI